MRRPSRSERRPTTTRTIAPPTCTAASTSAACAVERPRASWRNSTTNAMIASCPASTSALAEQSSHMRRSRSGLTSSLGDRPRRRGARAGRVPARTAQTIAFDGERDERRVHAAGATTSAGSASAPAKPPSGIAAWRIPSARPRSSARTSASRRVRSRSSPTRRARPSAASATTSAREAVGSRRDPSATRRAGEPDHDREPLADPVADDAPGRAASRVIPAVVRRARRRSAPRLSP